MAGRSKDLWRLDQPLSLLQSIKMSILSILIVLVGYFPRAVRRSRVIAGTDCGWHHPATGSGWPYQTPWRCIAVARQWTTGNYIGGGDGGSRPTNRSVQRCGSCKCRKVRVVRGRAQRRLEYGMLRVSVFRRSRPIVLWSVFARLLVSGCQGMMNLLSSSKTRRPSKIS